MTRVTGQPSATPILDLLKPMPEPDVERITGRFAFPFLTAVAAIVVTENYSFLVVPFGFLIISFLTIGIHELGHLFAGWCVGLRFKSMTVGPFKFGADSGGWNFRIQRRFFRGFASMSLDKVQRVRRRLVIFISGGPLASILCGIVAVLIGEIGLARYDSSWLTFLEFLGAWSLFIGFLSLIPYPTHGFANDAMLLRALLFSKPEAMQMIASYALSISKENNLFPPDYARRWFRMTCISTRIVKDNYSSNWLAYETAPNNEVAGQYLERCLAGSARMDENPRDKLIAEAAVFTACRRGDSDKAEIWAKRIKAPHHLHQVWQARVAIAILCARNQFENAIRELDRGLSLIREAPESPQRQRLEAAWVSWRQEIQQHLPVKVA